MLHKCDSAEYVDVLCVAMVFCRLLMVARVVIRLLVLLLLRSLMLHNHRLHVCRCVCIHATALDDIVCMY